MQERAVKSSAGMVKGEHMEGSGDSPSQSEDVIHFAPTEKSKFLRWRRENPDGYVLNETKASAVVFHIASCRALADTGDESLAKPKHCAIRKNRRALLALAREGFAHVEGCQRCGPGYI
jgi:hypothetical protein